MENDPEDKATAAVPAETPAALTADPAAAAQAVKEVAYLGSDPLLRQLNKALRKKRGLLSTPAITKNERKIHRIKEKIYSDFHGIIDVTRNPVSENPKAWSCPMTQSELAEKLGITTPTLRARMRDDPRFQKAIIQDDVGRKYRILNGQIHVLRKELHTLKEYRKEKEAKISRKPT